MSTDKPYKKPFKLEEISKKEVFSVPDGYFDKLPTIIQTRAIESTKKKAVFTPMGVLRLAMPVILVVLISGYVGFKYLNSSERKDAKIEKMIAGVSTEELVNYLDNSDITSDEILEVVSFDGESLEDFTPGIDDLSNKDLELLINDMDFGNENSI
ncbi:MAG: hypothetical protein KDC79_16035 [Cyclobacteriaceae bacterium]|nr:hypothetical protein [Cyclobacteriaceae bacterium]